MAHRPFVQDKPSHRPARFAQRVKEELTALVPSHLKDPRLEGIALLTITSVEVTPDLKYGTVMFTLTEQDEKHAKEITGVINQASNFLRRELMRRLNTKITPHLTFKYDRGLTNTLQIESLLKTISNEDKDDENK